MVFRAAALGSLEKRSWVHAASAALVTCSALVVGTALAEDRGTRSGEEVSLRGCLAAAMVESPVIRQAGHGTEAATAAQQSVRGGFGPALSLDGNVTRWDKATVTQFGGGGFTGGVTSDQLPVPQTEYEALVKAMFEGLSGGGGTEVQKQVTWSLSATVAQPLTPLYAVSKAYDLAGLGVDVARLKEAEVRGSTALGVVDAYLGHLQARAVLDAVHASIKRVEAALERVRKFKEAQLVGKGDVLKVQVALASVKQAEVQSRNAVALTLANLASVVGWGATAEFSAEDIVQALPRGAVLPVEESVATALRQRPELAALRKQVAQAGVGEDLVVAEYIPTVVAVGSASHNVGSRFREEDSWFVGATLNWKVWEWGKTWYKQDEARARTRLVQAALDAVSNLVELEVKKAHLDLAAALETYNASGVRVEEAEENFRVQKALYEAEYKTSTDLLDAEGALTEATAQRSVAFYKVWSAWAALGKATGAPVDSWLPPEETR